MQFKWFPPVALSPVSKKKKQNWEKDRLTRMVKGMEYLTSECCKELNSLQSDGDSTEWFGLERTLEIIQSHHFPLDQGFLNFKSISKKQIVCLGYFLAKCRCRERNTCSCFVLTEFISSAGGMGFEKLKPVK